MLKNQLEDTGESLFKHRSYIPLILYVLATVALIIDTGSIRVHHHMAWNVLCLSISLFGLLIRILTIGYIAKNTSGRNTKHGQIAGSLNKKGMYSLVRHPLYLGNFFMWFGLMLYVAIPWVVVLGVFFFYLIYERIMLAEERYISQKFAPEFEEWAQNTSAFFPSGLKWQNEDRQFNIKRILRREPPGILALSITFVYLDLLKNYVINGDIEIQSFWLVVGIFGIALWVILRSLRKWTNVLNLKKNH